MAQKVQEISVAVPSSAGSQAVAVSAVSAQSAVIESDTVLVHGTVDFFVVQGSNPTAVANTCMFLPKNVSFRLSIQKGNRLAFIAGGAGTVYVTPGV